MSNMKKEKRLSSDIIADAIVKYWKEDSNGVVPVVVYFCQKHEYESDDEWEFCVLYVRPLASLFVDTVKFDYDFCEGHTDVKNIYITTAEDVFQFYYDCHYDYIKSLRG